MGILCTLNEYGNLSDESRRVNSPMAAILGPGMAMLDPYSQYQIEYTADTRIGTLTFALDPLDFAHLEGKPYRLTLEILDGDGC